MFQRLDERGIEVVKLIFKSEKGKKEVNLLILGQSHHISCSAQGLLVRMARRRDL